MIDDQPTEEHWLTYTDAAERLGLTVNAVRALARRQGWPRRSPNVIGGHAWVAVPAERLAINGHVGDDRRSDPSLTDARPPVIIDRDGDDRRSEPAAINDHDSSDQRSPAGSDRRSDEILIAVQETVERITEPLREQIADLKNQLAAEKVLRTEDKERADHAEIRVQELQQKLEAEMIEHRQMVALLLRRRSWWPWRRRS